MPKNKEKRFEDVRVFPNVFEYPSFLNAAFPHKGAWNSNIFQNNRPITLELACGKGEYTIALAKAHPQKNFTGVDVKGNRLWVGAKTALSENLDNVRFLRIFIDHLDRYFSKDEISDIWITFPDPYLKSPKTKKKAHIPKVFIALPESMFKKLLH